MLEILSLLSHFFILWKPFTWKLLEKGCDEFFTYENSSWELSHAFEKDIWVKNAQKR